MEITVPAAATRFNKILEEIFTDKWHWPKRKGDHPQPPPTKRMMRRVQYGAIHKLYSLWPKDAAKSFLSRRWRSSHTPVQGLSRYWADVMGQDGPKGLVLEALGTNHHWDILTPISILEAMLSLRSLGNSAPSIDKLSTQDMLAWDQQAIQGLMNTFFLTETLSPVLNKARMTMIPKVDNTQKSKDFRPILVTPILARALHKILASRMRDCLNFSPIQFDFLKRDGCLEASTVY